MSERIKFHFLTLAILSIASLVLLSIGWGGDWVRGESTERPQKKKYKYLGAVVCMECHAKEELGKQFQAWTGSEHARAYLVLGTGYPEMIEMQAQGMVEVGHGRDIAREAMRLGTGDDCLKCHAKGAQVDKSFLEPTFHFEDGVQCETCHGPGSGYVIWMREITTGNRPKLASEVQPKMPTMEDCLACHREKPSHAVLKNNPFDFEKAWKKIAHSIPQK
jgi:hypothetical protein